MEVSNPWGYPRNHPVIGPWLRPETHGDTMPGSSGISRTNLAMRAVRNTRRIRAMRQAPLTSLWSWDGGFHGHGGTPIAGWFIMESPIKMDDN